MKHNFLVPIVFFAAILFTRCEPVGVTYGPVVPIDSGRVSTLTTITADSIVLPTRADSAAHSSVVRIKLIVVSDSGIYETTPQDYTSGTFALSLPASVPQKYLVRLMTYLPAKCLGCDSYVMSPNVGVTYCAAVDSIIALNVDGTKIGTFKLRTTNRTATARLLYTTLECLIYGGTMTGSAATARSYYFDKCQYYRGWNIWYENNSSSIETRYYSTQNNKYRPDSTIFWHFSANGGL